MQSLKAQRGFLEGLVVAVVEEGVEVPEDVEGTGVVEVGVEVVEVDEVALDDIVAVMLTIWSVL